MVVYELVAWALGALVNTVGLGGIAIGALAAAVVALWYLRELADVLVVVARYSRTLSILGFLLLVVLVGGDVLGVVEFDAESLFNRFTEVLH